MAKHKAQRNTIPGFTLLAPSIHEYTPPQTHSQDKYDDSKAPSLVVLCTWTGAQNRHIVKYTAEYQSLFPYTRILVITTTAKDLCFRTSQRKQDRLAPAVSHISSLAYLRDGGNTAGILLHVFSEGGSNKACELAEAYLHTTHTRLPAAALCLDSTPGHARYLRLCSALNKSLPRVPVLRHAGLLCGSAVLGVMWLSYKLVRGMENNVITRTRRRLLDRESFHLGAPRCYLYSRSDALIASRDVSEHARDSAQQGVPVREVVFEGSGHVGHARAEPGRYWGAVVATWDSASGAVEEKSGAAILVVDFDKGDFGKCVEGKRWSDVDSQHTLLPHRMLNEKI
jgi:hypothetical protein